MFRNSLNYWSSLGPKRHKERASICRTDTSTALGQLMSRNKVARMAKS